MQLIAVLGYMIYLNWQLTLGALIIAPRDGYLNWLVWRETAELLASQSQNRISDLSALLTEVFSGIRLIKAFAG